MVEVLVKSSADQMYKQEIQAGNHKLVADAVAAVGGGETGPDPHELLLGALGACTAITLQMFAQRREWKLESVSVKLEETKVDDPNQPGRQMTRITRKVDVKGDLTPDQMDALKVAADKCLIHKLLTGPKEIVTDISRG
jgi:putative redox protein